MWNFVLILHIFNIFIDKKYSVRIIQNELKYKIEYKYEKIMIMNKMKISPVVVVFEGRRRVGERPFYSWVQFQSGRAVPCY